MRRDTVNYTLVGAFVLAMGAALLVMMYTITGHSGATEDYVTYFRNVAGLKYGTGVYYEGFRVGQIEQIEPEGAGPELRYRVRLSVRDDWRIPEDSIANIVSSSLISAMMIEIHAGTSTKVLSAGDTLRSNEQSNLFAALGRAADDFGDLSRSGLRPLLENLDRRTGQLTDEYVALRRDNLAPFIDSMRADVKQLLRKVDDGATRLQRLLSDDNQQLLERTLRNVSDATGTLDQLVNDVQQTNAELRNTMAELNRLVVDNRPGVTAAVADLQHVLTGLRAATDNLEGRIDSILYHLEGTTRNADEFTRSIRENPGSLLRNNPPREEGVAR